MAAERILIVEDEAIVATDLESIVQKLGYLVSGTVPSGEEAIERAEQSHPDLVLMDIRLKGAMDGIDAAEQITARFNIPVTYLTAYADETTLDRAKTTIPYGYILKPYQENDIRAAVEMALYKHKMESMISTLQNWHASALQSIPDAVVATDKNDRILFLNENAEGLFGWKLRDVYGKPLHAIFSLPIGMDYLHGHHAPFHSEMPAVLSSKDGHPVPVHYSVAPMRDIDGSATGLVVVFHPVLEKRQTAHAS